MLTISPGPPRLLSSGAVSYTYQKICCHSLFRHPQPQCSWGWRDKNQSSHPARGHMALFLRVYSGQGPEEFCGSFGTTSVKTNFLISLLLWAKNKAVFPWSTGGIWRRTNVFPRLPFTKSRKRIKVTLMLPLPPAFSSLLPRNPFMPHPVMLHLPNHYSGYLALSTSEWAGSPSLWSPGAQGTLWSLARRKLALHASPSSSQSEMCVLLSGA